MRDILPKEERYWKKLYHSIEDLGQYFQYGRIETPLLEEASLFVRSVGKGTDVVDKEMYLFEDKDGTKVCLRPENTASVVRAYIGNGLWNQSQPVKLWYYGPMFRHDRPQAGRYRQFWQVGFESLGSSDPSVDAELILIAYDLYKDLGLSVTVRLNSLGIPEERERYRNELVSYYRSKRSYICGDCKNRLNRNPLRLLDCKAEECRETKDNAPQIIDYLGSESKNHLMKVLEYLDAVEIPYQLDHALVRGLDYYTHTVFEFYVTDIEGGAQSALGGGGRYDLLAEQLGGKPTPACGFSLGLDRIVSAWRENLTKTNSEVPREKLDIYLAQLGEEGRRVSLRLLNDLRASGIKVGFNFSKSSLKAQMELADSAKVQFVLIIGQKEVQDKTVIIRDMESGIQEVADVKKVEGLVKRKLGRA
ncbi:MAG: histidine--tRNA ligase [Candidatus Magasanikbacteria bacterium RIFOXYC2_FULL_42_28]|uniref:Histidine--tRNA ligase n=1 Tax=Candidatus Magasanikbacteria bacterium RIFOXYC2_FULL_42_28 TaxID=1798704 RepID=A0A1F6NYV0_9BACT|nr:MAG: histidine--tRNA ligase [Candidatus Magasanikbacteria bacterium RIFOXYC2_FULL_42_28]